MPLKPTLALALLAVLATGATAPLQAAPKVSKHQACFYSRNVSNFRAADDSHVYFRVGVRDVYELKLFGTCPDVNWAERIALVPTGGSNFICSGLDADLVVPSPVGRQRCPVRDIRKLTPEEVAALPAKARP